MEDQVLTAAQVAALLQMDERTIYKLAKSGEIPGFKISNQWRFLSKDIEKRLEEKKNEVLDRGKKIADRSIHASQG